MRPIAGIFRRVQRCQLDHNAAFVIAAFVGLSVALICKLWGLPE